MNEKTFYKIVFDTYIDCKGFFESEDLPEIIDGDFIISGVDSLLSSLELVSFLAELETNLLKENVNISFIDQLIDEENNNVSIKNLFEILIRQ